MDEYEIEARLAAHRSVLRAIMLATKTKPLIEALLDRLDIGEATERNRAGGASHEALMTIAWTRAELLGIATGNTG